MTPIYRDHILSLPDSIERDTVYYYDEPDNSNSHIYHNYFVFSLTKIREQWNDFVIELKAVEFEPEFVGKLNFYLSAVDDQLRTEHDNPTIGLLICRKRDKLMAEYALRDVNKSIRISEYKISESLHNELKSTLRTIEEIEECLEQRQ